jgi:hypothetical protein
MDKRPHASVGADLSRAPPIYRPSSVDSIDVRINRKNPTKRLEDTHVLWYHLPITHLLNASVSHTSHKGENPMSKRLAGYDYSQPGFYFVTICTLEHRQVFGTIYMTR